MEILLTMTYVALCFGVFKIFRIPVNQWTLATAALGGIFGLSLLFITMAYNQPYSTNARIYFAVTPIVPNVRGRVIEVPVEANTPLHKDDVLFRLDPTPFQYAVEQKKAALAEAEQNVDELKSSLDQAKAATERANSEVKLAQENYDRQSELFSKKVIAQVTLDTYTRNLEAAKQSYTAAQAAEEHARLAYSSQIGGVNTNVAQLQAALNDAQFNLDQTVVRAPGDGFVTQVALEPGVYTVPLPLKPAMTFVNTGSKSSALGAAFQQNALQRVRAGDDAEIAFQAVPGRVFRGKVRILLDAIASGQMQASGTLQDFGGPSAESRGMALIDILDDTSSYQIPVGSAATVAVYTDHFEELSLLRKILLRMHSWKNYIFLESD
jgi:multidrug resistance efflux pump